MKKFFLIIIISLSLSPSLLANKIFLSQFGYSVEIPDDYVKYTRSYLEKNMDKIISQSNDAGFNFTEEIFLNQMSKLEKLDLDQFVNINNIADSITFYSMENIPVLTEKEIKNNKDEIKKVTANQNGLGDYDFTVFEIIIISVDGKKGHRILFDAGLPTFFVSDTWIEIKNKNNLRIVATKNNTDFFSFNNFIEEIEATLKFR